MRFSPIIFVKCRSFLYSPEFRERERQRDRQSCTQRHHTVKLPRVGIVILCTWDAGCATFRVTSATKTLKTVYHLGNPGIFRGQGSSAIFMASRLQKIVTLKSLENLLSTEVKLHSLSFCRKGQGQ